MRQEILADRLRVVLLPLLSRAPTVPGSGLIPRLSSASGASRDRLWKISRNLVTVTEPEAERVARAAAALLDLDPERAVTFLREGGGDLLGWLRERAPLPRQCTHCGTLGGWQCPLQSLYAVHEACYPALLDRAQERWIEEVERQIHSAPGLFFRAWEEERRPAAPLNLFSLSTRAGMEFRTFRRAWILAGLPRRKVPRERPEPLSRRVRLLWTAEVEAKLPEAPEPLQELWSRAREAGVRLNLEQLAEFARVPHWQFRKRWVAAGLPTPKQVQEQADAAAPQQGEDLAPSS